MGVGQQFQCSWQHLQYGCREQEGLWGREVAAEVPYREDSQVTVVNITGRVAGSVAGVCGWGLANRE